MIDNVKTSDSTGSEVDDLLQKKEFGASLRIAREKSAMSESDVAEKLLISVDIIKALESSQADALPTLIFTQGYIRSYARLLGVSADKIISDYVKTVPASEQVLTPHSVLPAQRCCNDKVIKLISYSFVITAVVVFVLWFINTDFKIKPEIVNNIADFNLRYSADDSSPENSSVDNSQDESNQLSTAIKLPSDDIKNTGAVKSSTVESDKKIAAKTVPVITAQTESSEANQRQTLNNVDSIAKPDNSNVTEAADKLFLSALGDSWCEIQDSTGKRLYYQLLNRGEEVELIGVAPFMVFLGNAPKIRVEVNNKIVDFENLINRNSNIASLEIAQNATVTSQSSQ